MTRLVVTVDAESDISIILTHLEREAGLRTAESYGHRFRDTIIRLVAFPESGAPRPALGEQARIAIVYPYVLFYDYHARNDLLMLLRVLHGKAAITAKLMRR